MVLITIAVIAGIVAITLFYSDWGQNRMRAQLESTLSVDGHRSVTIGELSIALTGKVNARDVVVRDRDGAEAISIGRAEIALQLRPLLSDAVIIDSLVAVNCSVLLDLDDAYRSNLQGLLAPSTGDGPGMTLSIDELRIRRGQVAISRTTSAGRTGLAEIRVTEVNGRFESSPRRKQLDITRSELHWDEHEMRATAVGAVALDSLDVTIDNLTVSRSDSRAVGSGLSLAIDDGAISGIVQGALAHDDLPWLCHNIAAVAPYRSEQCSDIVARIPSSVAIDHAIIKRSAADAPWNVETSMRSADTSLVAEVTLTTGATPSLRGTVELQGIPPELVLGDALPGQLDAPIDLTIDLDLPDDPGHPAPRSADDTPPPKGADDAPSPARKSRGALTFGIRTRHKILGDIDSRFALWPGKKRAELEFHSASSTAQGSAERRISVDGSATYTYGESPLRPVEIERARLYGSNLPLARLAEGRVAGTLTSFQARAEGPWSRLVLKGAATATGLARRAIGSTRRARIDFTVARVAGDDVMAGIWPDDGRVRLQISGARRGEYRIASASARGTVSYRDGRLRAEFSSQATGTRITTGEQTIVIDRLVGAAAVAWQQGRWSVDLGRYELTTRNQQWRGRGGRVAGLSSGRIDIDQIVALSKYGQLSVDGFLSGSDQRDEIVLGATELDLNAVASIWGLPLRGTASGLARVERRLEDKRRVWRVAGDAEFYHLAWLPDAPTIEGAGHIDLEPGRLSGDLVVREPASESQLSATLDIRPPADPFDRAAWRRLDLGRITRAKLSSDHLDLDTAYTLLARRAPVLGQVSGSVELLGGQSPRLEFAVNGDRATIEAGARRYRELSGQMRGQWSRDNLSATATVSHRDQVLLTGDGSLALGLPALWQSSIDQPVARTRDLFMTTPLAATLRADGVDVARFSDAGWIDLPRAPASQAGLQGQLVGSLEVTGSLDRPRAEIRDAAIYDFYAAGISLERIAITGNITSDQLIGEITGTQVGSGMLRAKGRYLASRDSGLPPALDIDITARAVDLSFARAFATGRADIFAGATGLVDGDIQVRGPPGQPTFAGQIGLRDGGLWLAGGSRRVHDVDATLLINQGRVLVRTLTGWLDRGRIDATGMIDLDGATPRGFRGRVKSRDLAILLSEYTAEISGEAELTGSYLDGEIGASLAVAPSTRVVIREIGRTLQGLAGLADVVYVDSETPSRPDNRPEHQPDDRPGSRPRNGADREINGEPPDDSTAQSNGSGPVETIRLRVATVDGASTRGETRRGVTVEIDDLYQILNATIEARVDLDLDFRDWSLTTMSGRIDAVGGEAELLEYKYRIEKGQLAWEGRSFIPSIDMELVGEFPVATVYANLSGSLIDPERTLQSEPPYDETTILAIINGADPDDPESVDDATLSASADLLLLGDYRRRLPTLVRPDVVRIYSDGFAIGKRWFSRAVLVGYRYRGEPEAKENQNEVNVRIRVRRDLLLEAQYGDSDVGGLDLLWRIRF